MHLSAAGILISMVGLGLLLAQVARAIEPGILLALASFVVAFVGILISVAAALRRSG